MNTHYLREFIFDEEQCAALSDRFRELEPDLVRAEVYKEGKGGHVDDSRLCDHVGFGYKEFPDISLSLLEYARDLDLNSPDDLWFAQFEFIRYEGSGQTFRRHRDDSETGERHNRLFTSVTLIERSDDLQGCKLNIWTPCGKEYLIDLAPYETIIFPAYYEHEATPLVSGRRVVLVSWGQRGKGMVDI